MGLYNLTRLDLDVAFSQLVLFRVLQVLGLAFIFIPISTLNYVGVPREKNNQISSFSNFARNIGGSAGTAMLTTFLQRTAQTHQQTLGANAVLGGMAYAQYVDRTKAALMGLGEGSVQASQSAAARAYVVLGRQANMLSYQNAFWVLSVLMACLVPLPFIMRKPPPRGRAAPEEVAH
jgi:DHA2 family multidrug resistance protein